jgi:serine phosphatase RsbU (regulator of sigma subunit)/CHASE2 domain-containing sensor protein
VKAAAAEGASKLTYGRITAIGIALLAVLAALIWFEPRWNLRLQSAWFDTYQILKPREVVSMPVTVVEVDDKSIARFGQWPWPRTLLAELVRDVEREQPLAIGVDILMSEPDRLSPERLLPRERQRDPVLASRLDTLPSSDSELARAIAAGPVVLGLAGTHERSNKEVLGPPFIVIDPTKYGYPLTRAPDGLPLHEGALGNIDELDRVATGHGVISAGRSDDVIRRVPLAFRINERPVPSLPMEMLRVALRAPAVRLLASGPSVKKIAVGDFVADTEADGELRVYYSKHDSRRYVSAIDVLDGKVDPLRLRQKLVLVSVAGLAAVDYQNTPLGERMTGSEIHAQVLENLYDQTWLTRPSWAPALELTVFVLLGLALIWATPRWKPANAAMLALGGIALPIALGIAAFLTRRLVFDAAAPALGLLILFSVLLVLTLTEAGRQRRRLERVVQVQREQAAYISGELEAAKRIQTGFLPRADLLRDERRVELAVSMSPAREVGGDLYDFFMLDEQRLFFLVGDVAGKGLSASMFMAVSKALCKSTVIRSPQATISELMRVVNAEVSRDNPEMFFVTAFAGVLNLESGELAYCNAGHENPYLLSPDGSGFVRLADAAGPPLCAVEGFAYRDATRTMRRGELLCVVTDGVVDAQNRRGERYGSQGLQAIFAHAQGVQRTAAALMDAVCNDVQAFAAGTEPADDLTVLVVRWVGPAAVR